MSANLPVTVAFTELERMAQAFAKSGMFGAKTTEQAMALLLLAQGEGLHPAIAMRDFDIIQCRPAKKAEAMLRSFIAAGGKVEWHCMTDEKADATFSHENGGSVRIDWDMARAKKAGVGNKDNYNKYPRQMLANRVISEGCRRIYPASTSGLYVPEEVIHFRGEKDITPSAGALSALPIANQEVIQATAAEVKALLANDQTADAYALWQDSKFDTDQQVAFWSLLDSKQKGVLGRMGEAERAAGKGTISEPQKKRLEARIKELNLKRDDIKAYCQREFAGVEHFADLTPSQYRLLDAELDKHVTRDSAIAAIKAMPDDIPVTAPARAPQAAAPSSPAAPAAGATINEAQESAIRDLLESHSVELKAFLLKADIKNVSELQATRFAKAIEWIKGKK